jgi:hypothetical protein
MNKRKVWSAIVVGAGALALLTGCDPEYPGTEVPNVRTADLGGVVTSGTITVDGRRIPCVTWVEGIGSSRLGGISCDWANDTPVR